MFFLLVFITFCCVPSLSDNISKLASTYKIIREEDIGEKDKGILEIEILDADSLKGKQTRYLPARVVVETNDGKKVDASGRGLYSDGRFYVEGKFSLLLSPGNTIISIYSGPNFIPLEIVVPVKEGKKLHIIAQIVRWYSPEEKGWFCGDNHLHTRHDPSGEINVDEVYTALQARAEGLDTTSLNQMGNGALKRS